MSSLKEKTVSGVKWSVMNRVLQKVISVGTFAILARILEPADFGLFALAFVAIDSLSVFKSFGIDSALIQRKDDLGRATDTAFFLIMAAGLVTFLVGWLIAPVAAKFFDNPHVLSIIQALVVSYLLSYIGKVPFALLQKQMRFQVSNVIDFIGSIANSVFAVLFALISPSVWSLVWAYLIKQCTTAVVSWRLSGIKLRWQFDPKIAKELFHYGKFMTGLGILWYLAGNIGNIVVGKVLGVAMLGYYTLAFNVGNFINTHFTQLISGVLFPAYSTIQEDSEALKRVYLKTVKFVSMISIPFSMILIVLAEEITLTLYGAKWSAVIPLMRIFGFVQLLAPIVACSGPVFMGCGKPKYSFYLTLTSLFVHTPFLILFSKAWGLEGAVYASLATISLFAPINLFLAHKIVQFRAGEFLKNIVPSIGCSIVMVIMTLTFKWMFKGPISHISLLDHYFVKLGIFSALSIFFYVAVYFLMDRPAVLEAKQMIFKLNQNQSVA
ncbi:MAG: lipopolysaccharide biosynthesis protein [Candidatus Omnitrophica bacterium]|nr:lipopolysaccharide biosynthesis protein [Candidatus Omnitrophota bacterium]